MSASSVRYNWGQRSVGYIARLATPDSQLMFTSHTKMVQQTKSRVSKLKKFRQFLKSLKPRANKTKRPPVAVSVPVFLPSVPSPFPSAYSYTYTYFRPEPRPLLAPGMGTLRQHKPRPAASLFSESEYEEMSSDFCTLPRKKMKYRIKQRVFQKSLGAILLEARKEIIEESSGDEADDTYVAKAQDNLYEELDLSYNYGDEIYEEIL